MKVNLYAFCKFLFCIVVSMASFSNAQAQAELPRIIPPTPEVQRLFKFMEYPMNHATGLPEISIPLYEITSGSLSVPISLSYHASGRKVYDETGAVGLGWTLNAGGMINRTIYGSPDFGTVSDGVYPFPVPLKLASDMSIRNDYDYLAGIEHYYKARQDGQPFYDSEYDAFSYYFNNSSGKFIFKDNSRVKTPAFIPGKPYKLEWDSNLLNYINIIDEKGNSFNFQPADRFGYGGFFAISSWVLSRIISADKTDTISFKYSSFNKERKIISQAYILMDAWAIADVNPFVPQSEEKEYTNSDSYSLQRLTEINFRQGKVVIDLQSGTDRIKSIRILNKKDELLRQIDCFQAVQDLLSDGNAPTHRLDSILFKDRSGTGIQKFAFEYYPTAIYTGSVVNVRFCDWWGYYNASGYTNMIPIYDDVEYIPRIGLPSRISIGSGAYDKRDPKLEPTLSGVLKKIIYPTGGSTEYVYELNKYIDGRTNTVKNGGGLRVQQVKTTEPGASVLLKTYKYGANESSYGFTALAPDMENTCVSQVYAYIARGGFTPSIGGTYRIRNFTSGFVPELSYLAEKPVVYPQVTEYLGTVTDNIGKTVYKYDYNLPYPAAMRVGSGNVTTLKWHVYNYNYWDNISMLARDDYKRNVRTDGSVYYTLRKHSGWSYNKTEQEQVRGLHVQRAYIFPQDGTSGSTEPLYADKYGATYMSPSIPVYAFSDYVVSVGVKQLVAESEVLYDNEGAPVMKSTGYSYNSHQLVNQTETAGSDGEKRITTVKYPFDYTGNTVLTAMTTRNMLDYPVEKTESLEALHVQSVKTTYKDWGGNIIAPQNIDIRNGSKAYSPRLVFGGYDNTGNLLTASKFNGEPVSYIYGYDNESPIAEVKNAAPNQIYHTSFEDMDIAGVDNTTGFTGRRCWNGTFTIPAGKRPVAGNYILSYWEKIGTGAWAYKEQTITNSIPTQVTSSGKIDEIRIYPVDAQMTTYTFDPLIGITSQCSANDQVTFYEYDAAGRLILIRDQDRNIVKTFEYNYRK